MSRVTLHIDETNPTNPKPALRVNGAELAMNDHELDELLNEILWAKDQISAARKTYFNYLARKYK